MRKLVGSGTPSFFLTTTSLFVNIDINGLCLSTQGPGQICKIYLWIQQEVTAWLNVGLTNCGGLSGGRWSGRLLHSVQHHTRTPTLTFPHSIFISKDPCFISITFLFPVLTLTLWSIFRTPYAWPCLSSPFHTHSLFTLTEDSVIPSQTYSSPLLHSRPYTPPSSYKSKPLMYSRVSSNIN